MHTRSSIFSFQSQMHKMDILFLKYAYFSLFFISTLTLWSFYTCALFYLAMDKEKLLTFLSEEIQFLKI